MKSKKRWYRKWRLDASREEVIAAAAAATDPAVYGRIAFDGPFTPPDCEALNGQTLVFRAEGRVWRFEILSGTALRFSQDGGQVTDCPCHVKTMDHEVFFINHLAPGSETTRQLTLVADTKTGCATLCDAHIGTPYSHIDVDREFFFGRLDGGYPGGELHHFTNEMVGKAIQWDYGTGVIQVRHIYNSNLYYSYCCSFFDDSGAWMAANPADYIKLRDQLYIFSFVEERQTGSQGLFLMDLEKLHDIAVFYGYDDKNGITSAVAGAKGEWAEPNPVF